METDLSLLHLIGNASLLVQLVMAALLIASFVSWAMIYRKRQVLTRARRAADSFEDQFWSGQDLVTLFNRINKPNYEPAGLEIIFQAGFQEFARLRSQDGIDSRLLLEGARRSMRIALNREIDYL